MSHESNRLTFVCLQYKTNKFQHQENNFDFSLIFFSENSLYITFVSLLMSNPDIGVATVAAEAGHAQPSTTLMIYTQQYKKRRESIRNQLSRELYEK